MREQENFLDIKHHQTYLYISILIDTYNKKISIIIISLIGNIRVFI